LADIATTYSIIWILTFVSDHFFIIFISRKCFHIAQRQITQIGITFQPFLHSETCGCEECEGKYTR